MMPADHVSKPLYFEDVVVGQVFQTGKRTLVESDIIAFATQWDPQPFHLDKEAGQASIFGRLCGSGLQTLLVSFRLYDDIGVFKGSALAGAGLDKLRWLSPVYPGDILSVRAQVTAARPTSKVDRGLVTVELETTNQAGLTVCRFELQVMVARRTNQSEIHPANLSLTAVVAISVDVKAAELWGIVADFQAIDRWLGGAKRLGGEGNGVGSERAFSVGEALFRERLIACDDGQRRLTYSLVEGPLPVADYRLEIAVETLDANHASMEWRASFRPVGIDPKKCRSMLERAYSRSMTELKVYAEQLRDTRAGKTRGLDPSPIR